MSRNFEPGISLCAIVKNEEANLPRMLASVRGLVDEIVIVDTGSTDRTVQIARQHDAKVLSHPFEDDFSAPRNTALRAATRQWVLVLDADEILKPEAVPAIRNAVNNGRVCGYYLEFWNDLGNDRVHRCGLMRLFRNDPSIRFDFCLHEQVLPSLIEFARRNDLKLAPLKDAVVLHDGYRQENVDLRAKDERNLRLYAKQVALHPLNAYSWYKFGDFLRRFPERAEESLAALEKARTLIQAMLPEEAKDLSYAGEVHALIALAKERSGALGEALSIAARGLDGFQESPNLRYVIAHLHAKTGDHRAALHDYARLRLLDRKLHAIPPEPGVTGAYAYFGMGRALANLEHPRAAMRCLELSLQMDETRSEPRILRARLRLETGDVQGAAIDYRTVLERHPQQHGIRIRLGQVLLHLGNYAEAKVAFEQAARDGAELNVVAPRLGLAYLGVRELENALDAFTAFPTDPDSQLGIEVLTALANGCEPRLDPTLRSKLEKRGSSWLRATDGLRAVTAPA